MNLLKKLVSAALSILMVSNFIFSQFVGANKPGNSQCADAHCDRSEFLVIPNMPTNIKAIHWNKNRCWWISSIMFLYYWTDFKEFIYENSKNKFENIVIGDNQDTANYRLFFSDLNEIFEVLDNCKGNVCYITNNEVKMRNYFNNLRNCGFEVINNCPSENILVMLLVTFNSLPLMERFGVKAAKNACYRDNEGHEYSVNFIFRNSFGGHFYIYLKPADGNKGFIIGQECEDDFKSIKFDDLIYKDFVYSFVKEATY